jgi:DNA-binding NtrC family response regulator
MPKMDGVELLEKVMEIQPDTTMVMISGHGDVETAVDCIKKGAFDYISKPPDLNRLINTIRIGLDRKNLMVQNKVLKKKVHQKYQMIGNSDALQKIHQMIDRVAPTDARVLITGANGTGKELIAHAIHQKSERSEAPLVEVNCAAIPSELIESELFGHEKGAFTSAIKQRKGKFETANGGTLFLDEVGDMSLKAQAKVLRALQEHKISRVGSDKEIKVNVRVLAATNKDLQKEIKDGNFREDLYHRLGVILIHSPALDERKEDIPDLAAYFIKYICKEYGIVEKSISKDALKILQNYSWSGNVREFRNVIERLIILSPDTINKEDVKSFAGK